MTDPILDDVGVAEDASSHRTAVTLAVSAALASGVTAATITNAIVVALFGPDPALADAPAPRDETHDSIDPSTGALTADATAARAALIAADKDKVGTARAALDQATANQALVEQRISADQADRDAAAAAVDKARSDFEAAAAAEAADEAQPDIAQVQATGSGA